MPASSPIPVEHATPQQFNDLIQTLSRISQHLSVIAPVFHLEPLHQNPLEPESTFIGLGQTYTISEARLRRIQNFASDMLGLAQEMSVRAKQQNPVNQQEIFDKRTEEIFGDNKRMEEEDSKNHVDAEVLLKGAMTKLLREVGVSPADGEDAGDKKE